MTRTTIILRRQKPVELEFRFPCPDCDGDLVYESGKTEPRHEPSPVCGK